MGIHSPYRMQRLVLLFVLLGWYVDTAFAFSPSSSHHRVSRRSSQNSLMLALQQSAASNPELDFKLVSLNVLAPCYYKIQIPQETGESIRTFEAEFHEQYMKRNEKICEQLLSTEADIICLQEFWTQNEDVRNLYIEKLCRKFPNTNYVIQYARRTSHWRERDDGLAVFVNTNRVLLQDYRKILFHDCGDRIAQMLLLAIKPDAETQAKSETLIPPQQLLCVNTHLLFPHNEYSTKIRVREMTKILGFLETYRQRELCMDVCGRGDVRVPVIIAGDFNGSPEGAVHQFAKSQNFRCAQEESWATTGGGEDANDDSDAKWKKWISHKSHRQELVAVDHVLYSNPSEQGKDNLPPFPDWTNLVYREIIQRVITVYGTDNMRDIFGMFDMDNTSYIEKDDFVAAIQKLGFDGEGKPSLTPREIEVLIDSADKNGDGLIDYKEFCDRFWLASNNMYDKKIPGRKSMFARSKWLTDDKIDATSAGTGTCSPSSADIEGPSRTSNQMDTPIRSSGGTTSSRQSTSSAAVMDAPVQTLTAVADSDSEPNMKIEFDPSDPMAPRPMGELKIVHTKVFPEALERGEWPDTYTLSDHGMVEVVFRGEALPPMTDDDDEEDDSS